MTPFDTDRTESKRQSLLFCLFVVFSVIFIKIYLPLKYLPIIFKMITRRQKLGLSFIFLSLAASVVSLAQAQNSRKRFRRWKVRPINQKRRKEGLFATLIRDMMKSDEMQFFKYTRMTVNQFNHLHELIKSDIQKDHKKVTFLPENDLF